MHTTMRANRGLSRRHLLHTVGAAGGLAKGNKLGRIVHGHPATTNIAFGGDDWKTLYFTSRSTLFSVKLKVAGLPVPVERRQRT